MTLNQHLFDAYKEMDGRKVPIRINIARKVTRISIVKIKMIDGSIKILKDVMHVLELKKNLISLSMLDLIGCTFKGESGSLWISKGFLEIRKGVRRNGLCTL